MAFQPFEAFHSGFSAGGCALPDEPGRPPARPIYRGWRDGPAGLSYGRRERGPCHRIAAFPM